jgi:hypothetical protein
VVGDACTVIEEHRVADNEDGAGPRDGDRRESVSISLGSRASMD